MNEPRRAALADDDDAGRRSNASAFAILKPIHRRGGVGRRAVLVTPVGHIRRGSGGADTMTAPANYTYTVKLLDCSPVAAA